MAGILIILFLILLLNILMVRVSGRKFGICLPVTLMLIPYFLYFSQFIFHRFRYGYVVLAALAGISLVLLFVKHDRRLMSNIGTIGLLYFLIIFFAVVLLDYKRPITEWDDVVFWGKFVKEMLRTGHWYSEPESLVSMHKDYPPYLSLFELFWCRLTGGYSESCCLMACHLFSQTIFMVPLVEMLPRPGKKAARADGAAGQGTETAPAGRSASDGHGKGAAVGHFFRNAAYCLVLAFSFNIVVNLFFILNDVEVSANKDVPLTVMFAYGVLIITGLGAVRDRFHYLALILTCASLLLTKQIGAAFVLMLIFCYSLIFLFCRKCTGETLTGDGSIPAVRVSRGRLLTGWLLRIVGLAAGTLFPYVIWKRYIKKLGIVGQFHLSSLTMDAILDVFRNPDNTLQRDTAVRYFKALFGREIITSVFPLPYVVITALLFLLLLVMYRRRMFLLDKVRGISLAVTFGIGTVGYALLIGFMYLFFFPESRMKILGSYERYMATYALAELLVLFALLFLDLFRSGKAGLLKLAAGSVLFLLLTGGDNASMFVPGVLTEQDENVTKTRKAAEVIEQYTGPYDRVFVISDSPLNRARYVSGFTWDAEIIEDRSRRLDYDYSNQDMMDSTWEAIMDADYVYIMDLNSNFNNAFKYLNGAQDFETGRLYRVTDGKLVVCG